MTSLTSLIVVLLAAYAYSAPVIVTELQNATLAMEVENATSMTRREVTSGIEADKRAAVTVGLSSSEDSDSKETTQPTEKLSEREMLFTEENKIERDVTIDISTPAVSISDERDITEDPLSTENIKRQMDDGKEEPSPNAEDERRVATDDTKRGIDMESSSMVDSSVTSSDEVKPVKRSLDNQPWLAAKLSKRSVEPVESSTDVEEITTVESTSEVSNIKRGMDEFGLTTEASEAFNRRAIGSVESVEAGESSTVIVVKIHPESTTEEHAFSSTVEADNTTEFIQNESSSTSDYETTVAPVEDVTSASSAASETTAKILAIIPGTIAKTRIAVQPVRISQGTNQTIVKTPEQNY